MPPITEIEWDDDLFLRVNGGSLLVQASVDGAGMLISSSSAVSFLVGTPNVIAKTVELRTVAGDLVTSRTFADNISHIAVSSNRILVQFSTGVVDILALDLQTISTTVFAVDFLSLVPWAGGFAYFEFVESISIFILGKMHILDLDANEIGVVYNDHGFLISPFTSCGNGIFALQLNNTYPAANSQEYFRVEGSTATPSSLGTPPPMLEQGDFYAFAGCPDNVIGKRFFSDPTSDNARRLVFGVDSGDGWPQVLYQTPYFSVVDLEVQVNEYRGLNGFLAYSRGPNSIAGDMPIGVHNVVTAEYFGWTGPARWKCVGKISL